ncbi:MAG: thioredoxin family protein [Elusimicrobia bacterium]|nr:thioredoxin family protein [Candidatus Liberimonas magnetica]
MFKTKILFSVILTLFVLSACAKTNPPLTEPENAAENTQKEGISWVYDISQGLKLANETNRPLMVDFMAPWCTWCKKLDKDVYTNINVVNASKDFINVKIDTDKFPEVSGKYGITGLPTIIFLNKNGDVIEKIIGYSDSQNLINTMTKALKNG